MTFWRRVAFALLLLGSGLAAQQPARAADTVTLGGPKDITRIYVERMLEPNGVKPGEFDMMFAGATAARASALQGGAVDAAIVVPPYNFQAVAAGFNELGLTVDYAPELPFSGS